jgi:hypothetical protein
LISGNFKVKLINNTKYRGRNVTQTLHTGYRNEKKF